MYVVDIFSTMVPAWHETGVIDKMAELAAVIRSTMRITISLWARIPMIQKLS